MAALVTFWATVENVGGATVAVVAGTTVLFCNPNENDGIEPRFGIGVGSAIFFGLDVMVGVMPETGKLKPPIRSTVFAGAIGSKLTDGFGGVTKVAF